MLSGNITTFGVLVSINLNSVGAHKTVDARRRPISDGN